MASLAVNLSPVFEKNPFGFAWIQSFSVSILIIPKAPREILALIDAKGLVILFCGFFIKLCAGSYMIVCVYVGFDILGPPYGIAVMGDKVWSFEGIV